MPASLGLVRPRPRVGSFWRPTALGHSASPPAPSLSEKGWASARKPPPRSPQAALCLLMEDSGDLCQAQLHACHPRSHGTASPTHSSRMPPTFGSGEASKGGGRSLDPAVPQGPWPGQPGRASNRDGTPTHRVRLPSLSPGVHARVMCTAGTAEGLLSIPTCLQGLLPGLVCKTKLSWLSFP